MNNMIISDKSDAAVYIDGEQLVGVLSVSIGESSESKFLYEMLTEEPWHTIRGKKRGTVKLKIYGDFPEFDDSFSVTVVCDESRYEFEDAVVKSTDFRLTPEGKAVTEVVISCTEGS